MGSKTFEGVRFSAYPLDHGPAHVHGWYAGLIVIVAIDDGVVALADRDDRVTPLNGKRSDVKHVVQTAKKYADELRKLWEASHG